MKVVACIVKVIVMHLVVDKITLDNTSSCMDRLPAAARLTPDQRPLCFSISLDHHASANCDDGALQVDFRGLDKQRTRTLMAAA